MKLFRIFGLFLLLLVAPEFAQGLGDPPFSIPEKALIERIRSAELVTSKGTIIFELYPDEAPLHVANLKYLADRGFYRGLGFSLFEKNYVIQAGRPRSDLPQPLWSLPPEFSQKKHLRGVLSMARQPDQKNSERRSHASQFNIVLSEAPHLDGNYSIFGKVVKGFIVLDSLTDQDRIQDFKVYISSK